MEKIQQAIEKARKSRQEVDQNSAIQKDTVKSSKPMPSTSSITDRSASEWHSLEVFCTTEKMRRGARIVAFDSCAEATPYDIMRTKLVQKMRQNNWKRLAVTSSSAGSGKTMTCLNLAFSLARQSDLKIMVVELDLRRPSMARVLGIQNNMQFSDVLKGKAEFERHAVRHGDNLIVALNQTSSRNSAELLQGTEAAQILDQIEADYQPDVMIFDTPPLLVSDDTLAFLDQIDCALLVVEAEKIALMKSTNVNKNWPREQIS